MDFHERYHFVVHYQEKRDHLFKGHEKDCRAANTQVGFDTAANPVAADGIPGMQVTPRM